MIHMLWNTSFDFALICGFVTMPSQANSLLKLVPTVSWGGKNIRLDVAETGAKIEYGCAFGTIDEPLLLKKKVTFEGHGIHLFERGGPILLGESLPERHPALYRGWMVASQMRLNVKLLETGKVVGDFSLGKQRHGLRPIGFQLVEPTLSPSFRLTSRKPAWRPYGLETISESERTRLWNNPERDNF